MMPLDRTIDMTDCTNRAGVFPPSSQEQLLHTSALLTSSPMPDQERRAKKAAYDKAYRATNREKLAIRDHKRYLEHQDKWLAYRAAYRAAHPEDIAAYAHKYREENPDYDHAYRMDHREEIALYRLENKEKRDAQAHDWRVKYPEVSRLAHAKRRALKYDNTPVDELLTEAQWRDILDQYHHRCAYCGKKSDHLTVDHVIPLIKGGKHSANNVVPACKHCNSTKQARTPEEWIGLHV